MRIKEVANMLNLSPRAIRFYEEQGLLAPSKDKTNRYRTFTEQELERLRTIISLREAGMPLSTSSNGWTAAAMKPKPATSCCDFWKCAAPP
ncbi:MerR family transcriptional regulator [Cohnella faecalis]|uniref:MerR family transcriptional regulator n=1 Tax=Cohnella faecalis TaxID=2315694 RepID=UPI001F46AECB|nr:MerR family transcriptional regulator [Cohnella faecalis]